ncbi:MAG: acyl-CoA synthetase [Betaproteobacteria bacterium]|nr:MAG: acyl-CoA synthetase [Betaproteobacteria bacterium]
MIPVLTDFLDRHLAERPTATAFIADGRAYRYAEFDALSRRAAAWLHANGIGPGDRVALWLVNRIEWLALLFGLARLGAAAVSVNTRYRAAELEHILAHSGARMLVLQPQFRNLDFAAILAGVDKAAMRTLERVVHLDAREWPERETPNRASPDAVLAMFTTSGTTSNPKLVMHLQRTIAFHALQTSRAYGFHEPGARLLCAIPFCGVYGFCSTLGAFAAGAPIVVMEAFEPKAAVELARRHAVTHTFGGDEMYRRMLELAPGHDPFPSARFFGFAAFQAGAAEFAESAWQRRVPLIGLYGSSEVQALFSAQKPAAPLAERIEAGGYPAAGELSTLRVRDVDSGERLPPGASGELEIRSPGNFAGYWANPEATAKAIDAEGFFRTGDIGRLRSDGSFVFEARRGDAFRLAGYLVSPLEIEDALKRIPGVADVQVVGVDISGQPRCVAFVIGSGVSEDEIISTAKKRLASFKVPARAWFVERFPVTESANGVKIQRARLREMALERLAAGR